jgi:hypothetical protein
MTIPARCCGGRSRGGGNRTPVTGFGGQRSSTELRPYEVGRESRKAAFPGFGRRPLRWARGSGAGWRLPVCGLAELLVGEPSGRPGRAAGHGRQRVLRLGDGVPALHRDFSCSGRWWSKGATENAAQSRSGRAARGSLAWASCATVPGCTRFGCRPGNRVALHRSWRPRRAASAAALQSRCATTCRTPVPSPFVLVLIPTVGLPHRRQQLYYEER